MSSPGHATLDAAYPAGAGAFLIKNADVQLALCDERLRIVAVNRAWAVNVAVLAGARVAARLEQVMPPHVIEQIESLGGPLGAPYCMFPIGGRDETARWVELGVKRLGRQYLLVLVDVTESRTQKARTGAARRARDALLAETSGESWRYDPDTDTYVISPELATDYGLEPPKVSSTAFNELRHPRDLGPEQAVRNRIARDGGSGEVTTRVRSLDDLSWRQVQVHMIAGVPLPSGLCEIYGNASAVSEVAKARDDARANAEFLQIALSAAQAGVFEIDHVAQVFRCSPEFVSIVGRPLTYEEGCNASWPELPPEDIEAMQQMQGRWGLPGFLSVDVRGGQGGRWIRFYCKVARDEAGIGLGAVGLVLDIEDSKRQELDLIAARKAAEAATESKSRFLASVSHEIRTPMNGIVGVLHLLKGENISVDGRKLLEEALACSGMLSQLINDVLDISKIEAGMLELAPEAAEPAAALKGVIGLLTPQAEAKGLYLRATADPNVGWAMIDHSRLRQCLFNLVGNAVKFTAEGGVEVRMFRPAFDRLRVEVTDTGIGISEEARSRLFQRFVQADDATTRTFSGTGLGLAISRSMAQLMDGDVGFDSEEGVGSTFWLEIGAPPVDAQEQNNQPAADLSLSGLSILLVDDNATNRLVGGKILEVLGAAASLCESGVEAVERAGSEAFDLILMDVNMPVMDGIEATRRIRALPGLSGQVPIVALTANVMAHQRQSYLEAGMNGVVPKPLSPAALLAEIIRVASGEPAQDADQAA